MIFSYIQARPLLEARRHGQTEVKTSTDLGWSSTSAVLDAAGAHFATGECLSWAQIEELSQVEVKCFVLADGALEPVQVFSPVTNRLISLLPTQAAPSMLIAGFVMHRIKEIDPMQHAHRMIFTLAPIAGEVLDTATGLGYTAILAARSARQVTTIELDPAVQQVARLNPWSRELFSADNITRHLGDAAELVPFLSDKRFDRVLHDPPALPLAGDLYSRSFYRGLHRVLKRGGRLFHYVGDPESKASGGTTLGVMRRLQEAGFSRVIRRPEAYGVVAFK